MHVSDHDVAQSLPPPLPRWVPLIDALTVVALVLAACVFAFGGFREYVGAVRISVRSWDRFAALALLLTAIRHLFVARPAMPVVVLARVTNFWRSEERRAVWPAVIGTRLGVLITGYLAVTTIGFAPGSVLFRVSHNELDNLPARWDAGWYLGIVTDGYKWDRNPRRQQNVFFFPAFPSAMRVVGLFFGKRWLHVGVALAVAAFFCALLYMYRLARDVLDPDRARTAVWALAAYPFSVYYSAPYTEGFFLLGCLGAFYHTTRSHWWRAAFWGFFVSLCRPNGFFIALPLAMLVLHRTIRERRLVLSAWIPIVAPAVGVLTYCLFLYLRFGDPLAWTKGQLAWGRVYVGIWPSVRALWRDRYLVISEEGFYHYSVTSPYDLMHTAAALFVLISVWPTVRRFGPAYGVFTAVNIVPPLVLGGMMSIGRMTSVLFPAFLWLGATLPARQTTGWIAAFCILQGLIAVLFYTWRPAF
jgi:hypothetical protein